VGGTDAAYRHQQMATPAITDARARNGSSAVLPLVSVITPVRNRSDYLRTLLDALAEQTVPREQFEVIVADDGSTDGCTDGIETDDGWIRVVHGPPLGSYGARNLAAALARAPVLAFIDSDCKPDPRWLESGLAALETADAAAGQIRFLLPERYTPWTLVDIEATKDSEKQVRWGNAETANMWLRRDLFERLGGFDDTLPEHGDFDIAERVVAGGATLVYAPDALAWHPTRDSARAVLRMLWVMNRWYAVRVSRAGKRPVALKLRCLVPLVPTARARLRYGSSIGLDRPRLRENGIEPTLRDELLAFPLNYLLLPYLRVAAQARGWWEGRKLR
jgi:glycosyltransferase involved in cell wall biosynthesis